MDAITLLKQDHKTVEKLFKDFEHAGDNAHVTRRNLVDRMIEELAVHAAVEEQLFYPVTRATVPGVEDTALESMEEHHLVKILLDELDGMDPEAERFVAKVTVLMENVRHHVEEEEGDYFPKVRAELGRNDLAELGDAMAKAKAIAPTHAHPRAPDTPPGNIVAGTVAGVVDRVGDTVSGIAQGGVEAARDLIAKILGNQPPRQAATGSPTTKKAASQLRQKASTATTKASRARSKATNTGKATTKAARSGAKATATSARKGAKRTAATASAGAKRTATTAKSGAKQTATTAKRASTTTRRAASSSSS
jgi:hemerythrin superfamily protein